MSTYNDKSYNYSGYASDRPTYNSELPSFLLKFHDSIPTNKREKVLDVATGTGIFARLISGYFESTVATDISEKMLNVADQPPTGKIDYLVCGAEDMSMFSDNSFDMITVATGAHWFKPIEFLKESKRVLKPNGTLAIFGYPGFGHFPKNPKCDTVLRELGMDKLGDYWDKGRNSLERFYSNYNILTREFGFNDVYHGVYPQEALNYSGCDSVAMPGPSVINTQMTWSSLLKFLKTFSSLNNYHLEFPDEKNAALVAVEKMMLLSGDTDFDTRIEFLWEQGIILCRA
ncbi:putative methyltransferase [Smittium mucronatum]|uniref:Putative methyltransferase n=1 Tax=Smittium mucronatum TaxID=133383 RepID=A0A1R0H353_9FUNG|nr:putative methyltransferase [Smittium mucronatum]